MSRGRPTVTLAELAEILGVAAPEVPAPRTRAVVRKSRRVAPRLVEERPLDAPPPAHSRPPAPPRVEGPSSPVVVTNRVGSWLAGHALSPEELAEALLPPTG